MDVIIVDNELIIRLGFFLVLFFVLALAEIWFPRRQPRISKLVRWGNNLGMSFFNSMLMKYLFPVTGSALAVLLAEKEWGLLNRTGWPLWVEVGLYVLVFDMAIYFQHRFFHWLGPLWKLHRMHHTDIDYDLTTGNRFHPGSIIVSLLIKLSLVVVMGPAVVAVLISEILLNLTSMFNHSNIRLPSSVDRVLRWVIVTPDMHRIHHSRDETELNRNFGFNFPWWDRLFGTYLVTPRLSQEEMPIGIHGFEADTSVWFHKMLMQPFLRADESRTPPGVG